MTTKKLLLAVSAAAAMCMGWGEARAEGPWDGGYSYTPWGAPTALVVPPRARRQGHYHWGVPSSSSSPISNRFLRSPNYGGYGSDSSPSTTPHWPSHTDQFGVYYYRAPRRY